MIGGTNFEDHDDRDGHDWRHGDEPTQDISPYREVIRVVAAGCIIHPGEYHDELQKNKHVTL